MSTTGKSMTMTISMLVLVVTLAVVGPTTAIGKGNKRTGKPAGFQQGTKLKRSNVSPSGAPLGFHKGVPFTNSGDLRSAASGARNPKQANYLLVGGAGGAGSLGLLDYDSRPIDTNSKK